MKLQQDQVWQTANGYVRITRLERLEVEYKQIHDLRSREGVHNHVTKKEFCRLLKGAVLLTKADIDAAINLP
ncbi:MAG: hypothetical protein H0X66_13520 [Verrucomicrobia bacterium]|nr:hypothetical protein [Verrucomicrobiota bacterium]